MLKGTIFKFESISKNEFNKNNIIKYRVRKF